MTIIIAISFSFYSLPFIESCLAWPEEYVRMVVTTGTWDGRTLTAQLKDVNILYELANENWLDSCTDRGQHNMSQMERHAPQVANFLQRYRCEHSTKCKELTLATHMMLLWIWERGFFSTLLFKPHRHFPYSSSRDSCSVCLFTTCKELLQNHLSMHWANPRPFSNSGHLLRGPRIRFVLGPFLQRMWCTRFSK